MKLTEQELRNVASVFFDRAEWSPSTTGVGPRTCRLAAILIQNHAARGPRLCLDTHGGFVCNLAEHHVEDHECNDDERNVLLETWPQDPAVAGS